MITINCYGSGSSGNFYLIQNEDTNIVLECGVKRPIIISNIFKNNIKLTDINACITSHSHSDHSLMIKLFADYDIPIYCTQETKDKYLDISISKFISINILDRINKIFKINSIQVLPLKVNHGDTTCYGFVLHDKDDDVLFLTDFILMEYNLSKIKFTKIYIETNYLDSAMDYIIDSKDDSEKIIKYKRQISVHCSLENAIRYLKSFDLSRCNKIVGIHLSKDLCNPTTVKQKIQGEFGIPTYCLNEKGEEK